MLIVIKKGGYGILEQIVNLTYFYNCMVLCVLKSLGQVSLEKRFYLKDLPGNRSWMAQLAACGTGALILVVSGSESLCGSPAQIKHRVV